jgi:hypothetical protein
MPTPGILLRWRLGKQCSAAEPSSDPAHEWNPGKFAEPPTHRLISCSTRQQKFVRELFNGSDEVIRSHPKRVREEAYVSVVHDVVAIFEACHRTTRQSDALAQSLLTEPPL